MIFEISVAPDNQHAEVTQELCSADVNPIVIQKTISTCFPLEGVVISETSCRSVCPLTDRISDPMAETNVSRQKDYTPNMNTLQAMQAVVDRGILHSLCAGCENLEAP